MNVNTVGELTKCEGIVLFHTHISFTPHLLIRDVASMVQRERAPQDTDAVSRGNLNPDLAGSHVRSEAGYQHVAGPQGSCTCCESFLPLLQGPEGTCWTG